MAHDPKALQAVLADAAPPDLELAFKPMFGGYAYGKAFASLSDNGLALKTNDDLRAEFLAAPGARPLRYAPCAPPGKSYIIVPDSLLTDRDGLRPWIARAAEVLAATPVSAKRRHPAKAGD